MQRLNLINVGYGNFLAKEKILAILKAGSSPIRRLIKDARENGKILDATTGKKTRSVLVMDNGFVALCAILPETLAEKIRLSGGKSVDEQ
jgi:extracellular matrix regulatory protein A